MKKLFRDDPWFTFLMGFCSALLLIWLVGWTDVAWGEEVDYWFKESAPTWIEPKQDEDSLFNYEMILLLRDRIKDLEERVKVLEENQIKWKSRPWTDGKIHIDAVPK